MKKHWYDHKSKLCPTCHFHRPAGERDTGMNRSYYPEGCGYYGYSFHEYPELADDCKGFITTEQYKVQERAKELLKRTRKNK